MATSTRSKLFIPDAPKSGRQLFQLAKKQLRKEGYLLLECVPEDLALPLIEGLDSDSDIGSEGRYRYGISYSWTINAEHGHADTTTRTGHSSPSYHPKFMTQSNMQSRTLLWTCSSQIFFQWINTRGSRPKSELVSFLPTYYQPHVLYWSLICSLWWIHRPTCWNGQTGRYGSKSRWTTDTWNNIGMPHLGKWKRMVREQAWSRSGYF